MLGVNKLFAVSCLTRTLFKRHKLLRIADTNALWRWRYRRTYATRSSFYYLSTGTLLFDSCVRVSNGRAWVMAGRYFWELIVGTPWVKMRDKINVAGMSIGENVPSEQFIGKAYDALYELIHVFVAMWLRRMIQRVKAHLYGLAFRRISVLTNCVLVFARRSSIILHSSLTSGTSLVEKLLTLKTCYK